MTTSQDMSASSATGGHTPLGTSYSDAARDHLWMHFTRHSSYENGGQVPVIVRGEGAYIYDDRGSRYLDGLAGLFVVQVGHGRVELAEAAAQAGQGAGVLPALVLRPPQGDRAGRAAGPVDARAT